MAKMKSIWFDEEMSKLLQDYFVLDILCETLPHIWGVVECLVASTAPQVARAFYINVQPFISSVQLT